MRLQYGMSIEQVEAIKRQVEDERNTPHSSNHFQTSDQWFPSKSSTDN
jgi:hypothetical protein